MPGFDGTGPNGFGPFSGSGAGCCYNAGYLRAGVGRPARGLRMRRMTVAHADMMAVPQQSFQADMLRNRVSLLQQEIGILQKRIEEIESTPSA